MYTIASSSGVISPVTNKIVASKRQIKIRCAGKGFGDGTGKQAKQHVKVSKRGKIASRQDPQERLKQLQKEQEVLGSQTQQQQQQQPPAASSTQQQPATLPGESGAGDDKYASVPQQVTDRMLKRILLFSGLPVATGLLLFPFFYFLKVTKGIDLPTWVVYVASTLAFGGGVVGISYGILSSSWDPRREGSLLGATEFKANLPILMERFKRN